MRPLACRASLRNSQLADTEQKAGPVCADLLSCPLLSILLNKAAIHPAVRVSLLLTYLLPGKQVHAADGVQLVQVGRPLAAV
jgi:hypothetical protein